MVCPPCELCRAIQGALRREITAMLASIRETSSITRHSQGGYIVQSYVSRDIGDTPARRSCTLAALTSRLSRNCFGMHPPASLWTPTLKLSPIGRGQHRTRLLLWCAVLSLGHTRHPDNKFLTVLESQFGNSNGDGDQADC